MTMYLLRVGADTTRAGGGFRSPIFQDRYLFIPIPECDQVVDDMAITYGAFTWMGRPVWQYVPARLRKRIVHADPEFCTPSYGSPRQNSNGTTEKNYNTLSSMVAGDIIVFYAAFVNERDVAGLYFFAYIVVRQSITYADPTELSAETQAMVAGNAHFVHHCMDQVIVVGDPEHSRVFNTPVQLSGPENRRGSNYYPSDEVADILGYRKSMNRSSIRRIESSERAQVFLNYLHDQGA
ncbi:hypothetical protein [Anaerobaca lacustris]|uniref:Nucleotide modification associated domain-containing protein n=1 Tax=Anaerobaca lacustris TaxID=3044600 RepID=A0AAW6U247_9BACT|nr:hypothetical protein [Sedimentisphaerales bacterium M17dextr]